MPTITLFRSHFHFSFSQLLGKLPQTVKGVGLELISSFEQPGLGKNDESDGEEEPATEAELARRKNIMGYHVGYIAVVRTKGLLYRMLANDEYADVEHYGSTSSR